MLKTIEFPAFSQTWIDSTTPLIRKQKDVQQQMNELLSEPVREIIQNFYDLNDSLKQGIKKEFEFYQRLKTFDDNTIRQLNLDKQEFAKLDNIYVNLKNRQSQYKQLKNNVIDTISELQSIIKATPALWKESTQLNKIKRNINRNLNHIIALSQESNWILSIIIDTQCSERSEVYDSAHKALEALWE